MEGNFNRHLGSKLRMRRLAWGYHEVAWNWFARDVSHVSNRARCVKAQDGHRSPGLHERRGKSLNR